MTMRHLPLSDRTIGRVARMFGGVETDDNGPRGWTFPSAEAYAAFDAEYERLRRLPPEQRRAPLFQSKGMIPV